MRCEHLECKKQAEVEYVDEHSGDYDVNITIYKKVRQGSTTIRYPANLCHAHFAEAVTAFLEGKGDKKFYTIGQGGKV